MLKLTPSECPDMQLTLSFLLHLERLRSRFNFRSLKVLESSTTFSFGNFFKAYWYRWAASRIRFFCKDKNKYPHLAQITTQIVQ